MEIRLIQTSRNPKTGNISQTYSSPDTCPKSCPFKGNGCYASYGNCKIHWSSKKDFIPVEQLKAKVQELSTYIIRHNVAGDIAKKNTDKIDRDLVRVLIDAYEGKKAYTYTHCKATPYNFQVAKKAISKGFVINFSCETIEQVKRVLKENLPAVMAVASMEKDIIKKDNILFKKCPADKLNVTCRDCKICTKPNREEVIVFEAHGSGKNKASSFLISLKEE